MLRSTQYYLGTLYLELPVFSKERDLLIKWEFNYLRAVGISSPKEADLNAALPRAGSFPTCHAGRDCVGEELPALTGTIPRSFAGWVDGLMPEESPGVIAACWG